MTSCAVAGCEAEREASLYCLEHLKTILGKEGRET